MTDNTIPQVLYDTPDTQSHPSELYVIHGTVLSTSTDPVKQWVVEEQHGYWDEQAKQFRNSATTLLPDDPKFCVSLEEVHEQVKKQVMVRVKSGFKYQMEWDPCAFPSFFRKFEIHPDGTRKEYR
jgi:hypothetical protein